jgi:RimJ/RimL family protein N-acetyltransferase
MLRAPHAGDAAEIARLMSSWDMAHWLVRVPYPYRLEHAESWIERSAGERAAAAGWPFLIVRRGDGLILGGIDLSLESGPHGGTLGYWIGCDYWGRGYATEAARVMLEFAFDILRVEEVNAHALVGNARSIRVLEKAGLMYGGRRHEETVERGRVDVEFYAISRAAWRSRR